MAFPVIHDGGIPFPALFQLRDTSSPVVASPNPGDLVEIDNPNPTQEMQEARLLRGSLPPIPGFIRTIHVDFSTVALPEFPPMIPHDIPLFVQESAEVERVTREKNGIDNTVNGHMVVLADYLIALALAETAFEKLDTQRPGTDAVGPYQITSQEWDLFLADDAGANYSARQRFEMIAQLVCAEFLTQRDWRLLLELATADNESESTKNDQYVPSFLSLFHARLVGPKAAYAVNKANADENRRNDDLSEVMSEVLTTAELETVQEQRARFVTNSPPLSVNGFFNNTSKLLRNKLTNAFSLFKDHYPPFAELPKAQDTGWMARANEEKNFWSAGDVTEIRPKGIKRIVEDYFPATDLETNRVLPWCGAFAAWCLANSGDAQKEASIIPGAARAANWMTWGNREIRPGSIKQLGARQLFGAVVVLHPGEMKHLCRAVDRAAELLM